MKEIISGLENVGLIKGIKKGEAENEEKKLFAGKGHRTKKIYLPVEEKTPPGNTKKEGQK